MQEVSGVGPRATSSRVSSEGDPETGSVILGISDRLVSAIVQPGQNQTKRTVKSSTVGKSCLYCRHLLYVYWVDIKSSCQICVLDLSLETIGPGSNNAERSPLSANGNTMEIDLESLARNNNGEKKFIMK